MSQSDDIWQWGILFLRKRIDMVYLSSFHFPSSERESEHFNMFTPTYYTSLYPFRFLSGKGLLSINFSDITIFAGGNGSGKSTVLNIIAEHLGLKRESRFNKSELFDEYTRDTEGRLDVYDREKMRALMAVSRIITSDDVFNHILSLRKRNEDVDFKRDVIRQQRAEYKYNPDSRPREINLEDPESIRRYSDYADMTRMGFSGYVKSRSVLNERTYSNGESGYRYFTDAIQPGGLYLLDEPENSLSAQLQIDLSQFIAGMARFYECQFIISSHSPFMLATPFAKIYDMDSNPVSTTKWTDIPSVRTYHDFFEAHAGEFRKG